MPTAAAIAAECDFACTIRPGSIRLRENPDRAAASNRAPGSDPHPAMDEPARSPAPPRDRVASHADPPDRCPARCDAESSRPDRRPCAPVQSPGCPTSGRSLRETRTAASRAASSTPRPDPLAAADTSTWPCVKGTWNSSQTSPQPDGVFSRRRRAIGDRDAPRAAPRQVVLQFKQSPQQGHAVGPARNCRQDAPGVGEPFEIAAEALQQHMHWQGVQLCAPAAFCMGLVVRRGGVDIIRLRKPLKQ